MTTATAITAGIVIATSLIDLGFGLIATLASDAYGAIRRPQKGSGGTSSA
jgi:hypothetical protein